ncbi:MAG: hypothetical protein J2P58_03795, partial [Acidimicrobiaceae bacterium]|nr:hypothetical protein [Acidimicrobiaceae bacterium]
ARTPRPGRSAAPRVPEVPLSPERALARLRPVLFHATAYGSWESIRDSGLRTASKLLADAGRGPLAGLREKAIGVEVEGAPAELRDQRVLMRSRIETHLDGIGLGEWLGILDERVHLFARQKELTALLTRYQGEGQDLLVFDTPRLLASAGDRVEVATVVTAAPEPWASCRCRGRDTFVPLALFEDSVEDIEEVTIVGGLEDVTSLVSRVVRHHPDRSTEVVWERP